MSLGKLQMLAVFLYHSNGFWINWIHNSALCSDNIVYHLLQSLPFYFLAFELRRCIIKIKHHLALDQFSQEQFMALVSRNFCRIEEKKNTAR